VVIGAHQVIGRGLARRVRRIGLKRMGLGKGRVIGTEGAVDLVGRDVQEAKSRLARILQRAPVLERAGQQVVRADDVGVDERLRPEDRAIDVRLGGEINDGRDAVLTQEPRDQRPVADVALDEQMVAVAGRLTIRAVRAARAVRTKLEPMNPAPPVTSQVCMNSARSRNCARDGRRLTVILA